MSKVRINDLARELEVKSKTILDALTAVGVEEKKTHSSSIEEDEAEKVRGWVNRGSRSAGSAPRPPQDNRQGFNLSHVSKPGDALKAILERKQAEADASSRPPQPVRPTVTVAPASNRPPANAPSSVPTVTVQPTRPVGQTAPAQPPRLVTPASVAASRPAPPVVIPAQRPATPVAGIPVQAGSATTPGTPVVGARPTPGSSAPQTAGGVATLTPTANRPTQNAPVSSSPAPSAPTINAAAPRPNRFGTSNTPASAP